MPRISSTNAPISLNPTKDTSEKDTSIATSPGSSTQVSYYSDHFENSVKLTPTPPELFQRRLMFELAKITLNLGMIEELAAQGARIPKGDKNAAEHLLWYARFEKRRSWYQDETTAVGILLDAGADPNVCDDKGNTPLTNAANLGTGDAVRSLLTAGAEVNARGACGATALHWAIDRGDVEITEILLKAGADPNIGDNEGYGALHLLAWHRSSTDMAQKLIAAGASLSQKDHSGDTPREMAIKKGRSQEFIALLTPTI